MNLITSGVMRGLTGASSGIRIADVSMGVYRQASARGDAAGMDRAAGYATLSLREASTSAEDAGEALKAAQAEARERQRAERRRATETRRAREADEGCQAATSGGAEQAAAENTQPGDETSGGTKRPDTAQNAPFESGISECASRRLTTGAASCAAVMEARGGLLSDAAGSAGRLAPSGDAGLRAAGRLLRVTA